MSRRARRAVEPVSQGAGARELESHSHRAGELESRIASGLESGGPGNHRSGAMGTWSGGTGVNPGKSQGSGGPGGREALGPADIY